VELKIYEGEGKDRDITFNMDANYFLFATLEPARPIAQGRVPEEKTRSATVLTGTPVAGMVYLDRPSPAGYFIFPDLSVRHEGKYRLSFALYEELKLPKDTDESEKTSRPTTPGADAHVTHRLEVKSKPFTVFSAKKFPGLTESTSLSRMVAEQGCRVRIRRDVRMRRRDAKKDGPDWDGYDEANAAERARVSATPDPSGYSTGFIDPIGRPRSASNASHHSLAHPLSRRTSLQDLNQGFTAPHTPQNAYTQASPYGPSPNQQYGQPAYMQTQAMQPPPPQYNGQHGYPAASMPAPPPPPQAYYGGYPAQPPQPLSQQQFGPTTNGYHPPGYAASGPPDERRSSIHGSTAPTPPLSFPTTAGASAYQPYSYQQQNYQAPPPQNGYNSRTSQQPAYGSQDYSRPPPPQPVQPPARASGTTTPLGSGRASFDPKLAPALPPLQVPPIDMGSKLEPASPSTGIPQSSHFSSVSTPNDSHKRTFSQYSPATDRNVSSQPLRQGARPASPYSYSNCTHGRFDASDLCDADEDECKPLEVGLGYRRANGKPCSRFMEMRHA
jgi:hypothetical protein